MLCRLENFELLKATQKKLSRIIRRYGLKMKQDTLVKVIEIFMFVSINLHVQEVQLTS